MVKTDLMKGLNCPKCDSELEYIPSRLGKNGKLLCRKSGHEFAVRKKVPILIQH